MKNVLSYLFPKYQTVRVFRGHWEITNLTDFGDYITNETSIYEIQYSKPLNKWRLRIYGFKPKKHPVYSDAVNFFTHLISTSPETGLK